MPCYPSIEDGGLVIEGHTYIYKGDIIKSPKTGRAIKGKVEYIGDLQALVSEDFKVIDNYVWGEDIPSITSTYLSNSTMYDDRTHYYLGKYLRLLRNETGLDLMPFYNCAVHKNTIGWSFN